MTRAIAFGTFDRVHKGHEYYLSKAKELADELVVVVALDKTVEQVKGKLPIRNEEQRRRDVEGLRIADKAVLGNPGDKLKIVLDEKPDIICLGYDQTFFTEKIGEKLKEKGLDARVVRIKGYKPGVYKSSNLNKMSEFSSSL